MARKIIRAVGYCLDEKCGEYTKGSFLMNHWSRTYYCPCCRATGKYVEESGSYEDKADYFTEVRVEFHYDCINEKYKALGIVKDEAGVPGNSYILYSPLIKTEKRALLTAEAVLANLQCIPKSMWTQNMGIGRGKEKLISFDCGLDEVKTQLAQLEKDLLRSTLKKG